MKTKKPVNMNNESMIGKMELLEDPIITKASLNDSDMVDHPLHYQGDSMEVIDIIEEFNLNFCMGNAIKYVLRADYKENDIEDLKKALWYIERELKFREDVG